MTILFGVQSGLGYKMDETFQSLQSIEELRKSDDEVQERAKGEMNCKMGLCCFIPDLDARVAV